MTSPGSIIVLPYSTDLVAYGARWIIEKYNAKLPFLDQLVVLVEEPSISRQLRLLLTNASDERKFPALLGPTITSLRMWMREWGSGIGDQGASSVEHVDLVDQGRELILIEALQAYPQLLHDSDPWRLSATLLALFDELELYQIKLGHQDRDFCDRLQRLYGIKANDITHCEQEATIIFNLWQAWQAYFHDSGTLDRTQHYCRMLEQSRKHFDVKTNYIMLGGSAYTPVEQTWIKEQIKLGHLDLFVQAASHDSGTFTHNHWLWTQQAYGASANNVVAESYLPTNNYSAYLANAFAGAEIPMDTRARQFKETCPISPIATHIKLYAAHSLEEEALAIETQTRLWRAQGVAPIGIIVEDRKLARRVRALLERSAIYARDLAGWTLATTSAATVIEKWLECLETDFHHTPFLDFLKSPFMGFSSDRDVEFEIYLRAIFQFEKNIVATYQIAQGLNRYLHKIDYITKKNPDSVSPYGDLKQLFLQVRAASVLVGGYAPDANTANQRYSAHLYCDALITSLQKMGVLQRLDCDPAGLLVHQTLQRLRAHAYEFDVKLTWLDFRTWLAQAFESEHYRPETQDDAVLLLSLSQSRLHHFRRAIIACNDAQHFPGQPPYTPYFNDRIRRELGLPDHADFIRTRFHDFRRLLHTAATDVDKDECTLLLTRCAQENTQVVAASPWLELITSFHQLAYSQTLEHPWLATAINTLRTDHREDTSLAEIQPPRAAYAQIKSTQVPNNITPSESQYLMDCPYKFFCASVLGLKATDEIRQTLTKSDFGNRVHRCLQATHSEIPGLPGPYPGPWNATSRDQAIQLMVTIADAVFQQDLENNFLHHAWLIRWRKLIPEYVDWQIKQAKISQVKNTEYRFETRLDEHLSIHGRIDRIDSDSQQQMHLFDYKTGTVDTSHALRTGESVQLLDYAQIDADVASVQFVLIADNEVTTKAIITGEELEILQLQEKKRLQDIFQSLREGAEMPARPTPIICKHCKMSGLCRAQIM